MINQHPGGERPAAGLVMEQIGKRFASVTALNAVTLRLNPGEIHGLIGENGAGKSTLIKILAGVYQADSGSATLDGHPLPLGNPAAIEAAGIRVIHQELNLIPHFTVAESVFLGQEYRTRWGALDRRRMKAATAQFFQQNWQLAIDPERLVRDLSLAERKLVQIARALIDGAARLVVFDEPTAPLEAQEARIRPPRRVQRDGSRSRFLSAAKLRHPRWPADRDWLAGYVGITAAGAAGRLGGHALPAARAEPERG